MAEFRSYRDYSTFAQSITTDSRYVRLPDQQSFLQTVLSTSTSRAKVVPAGTAFYRAQLGGDTGSIEVAEGWSELIDAPFGASRMKPRRDSASEGRANAKGIPVLYVTTSEDTAVAEVRAWVGLLVSIAQLLTNRDLRILDFNADGKHSKIYFSEPAPAERERAVWADMNRAFSRPVNTTEYVADYAPTQVLAEYLKHNGFDGIEFRSSLGEGNNLALFDIDSADVKFCELKGVTSVRFETNQASNGYYIADEYESGPHDA